MKTRYDDFIKIRNNDRIWDDPHRWEVIMLISGGNFRSCTFSRNEYETGNDLREDVLDLLRVCRFSGTKFCVFLDEKLVTDL